MKKISSSKIEKANQALMVACIVVDNQYEKVFKGYFSSFGASVAQAGLLPTIIFYEADSDQASERKKVITALKKMLPPEYQQNSLVSTILERKKADDKALLRNVTEAMIALKLALRMYKEKENQEGGEYGR